MYFSMNHMFVLCCFVTFFFSLPTFANRFDFCGAKKKQIDLLKLSRIIYIYMSVVNFGLSVRFQPRKEKATRQRSCPIKGR